MGFIRANEIRLVGNNVEVGVYPLQKGIELANELRIRFSRNLSKSCTTSL